MNLKTIKEKKEAEVIIGIDPGVKTGYAVYDRPYKKLRIVTSLMIHEALNRVKKLHDGGYKVFVRFEDARLRKFFGNTGREVLQGAGSVKRDCKIWEDFLIENKIPYEALSPLQKGKKATADTFKKITGYEDKTNEHGRDAGMICYKA